MLKYIILMSVLAMSCNGDSNSQNTDNFPKSFPVYDLTSHLTSVLEIKQIEISSFQNAATLIQVKNVSDSAKCQISVDLQLIDKNGSEIALHQGNVMAIAKADQTQEIRNCLKAGEVGYLISFSMIDLSNLKSVNITDSSYEEHSGDLTEALSLSSVTFANNQYSITATNNSSANISSGGGSAIAFNSEGEFLWWTSLMEPNQAIEPGGRFVYNWTHSEDSRVDLGKTMVVF